MEAKNGQWKLLMSRDAGDAVKLPAWYEAGMRHVWLPYAQMKTAHAPLPVVRTYGSRIVLADGRISMRVRPEVSQLDDANGVTLNGFRVPALTTRRAETTVELARLTQSSIERSCTCKLVVLVMFTKGPVPSMKKP